jgi:enamine deaminase RidA (YjgF/YER057c/UK114 family)
LELLSALGFLNMGDASNLDADARFLRLPDEKPPLMQVPAGFSFATVRMSPGLVWLAGHGPNLREHPPKFDYIGRIGRDLAIEEGKAAARLVGLNLLVSLRAALSSLNYVDCVLQVTVAINSADDFDQQSDVANGLTDLMMEVFQDAGRPARMALGAHVLPFNMAVEGSMIVSIRPSGTERG